MMRSAAVAGLALLALSITSHSAPGPKIVIGQSAPLSGTAADVGRDIRDGALAYFAKVNKAGGINGREIELVTLDDMNDRKRAGANAKRLLDESNAMALFGFASATLSMDAIPLAEAKGVAHWANFGVNRMAVLHYDDEVGRVNYETVAKLVKTQGQAPLQVAVKRGAKVDPRAFEAILKYDPQVIIVTTQMPPVVELLQAMGAAGKAYPVSALSFVNPDELAAAPGGVAKGTTVMQVVPNPRNVNVPVVKECAEAMKEANGTLNYTTLESCIAAKVLVEAIRKAGKSPTPQSIVASLEGMSRYDAGGFVVAFSKEDHHGSSWTDFSILSRGGSYRH